MASIGNSPTQQAFTPAVDYFSGTGSATAFTLSRPVASVAQVQVTIDNVAQNPSSAFTVSSNTITFTSAPLSGTNNIYVYYTSPITQVIAPGQGTVNTASLSSTLLVPPAYVSDQANTATGYFDLPSGTTAQRPVSLTSGQIRYNSTNTQVEYSDGTYWYGLTGTNLSLYSATYLIVAGGGAGANDRGGGGGAGGYLTGTTSLLQGTVYTATVGAGGASNGASGSNSSITGLTAAVGGGGGGYFAVGSNGGSGGGGGYINVGGSGTSGQGNAGGSCSNNGGTATDSGGGGGAGAAGGNGVTNTAGSGGVGLANTITGSSVYYAGGGGGSFDNRTPGTAGAGGNGGGGAGGVLNSNGTAGTANTGGGGGGGSGGIPAMAGGLGGSGVVIISVPTANYTGTTTGSPTVTTSGLNTILSYTASGTYTA